MIRWLSNFLILIVLVGLALHFSIIDISWLSWLGALPGDLVIHKGDLTLYLPFTSAFILSLALSLFSSLFSR